MCIQRIGLLALAGMALLATLQATDEPSFAQTSSQTQQWSPPEQIPDYGDKTQPPILVADQDGTVHAFHSQVAGNDVVVTYRNWSVDDGWSPVTDILMSPISQQALVRSVVLDKNGVFHLVFYGGNEQGSNLYYTWAPAIHAGDSQSWSSPVIVGPGVRFDGDIAVDSHGNLMIVYASLDEQGVLLATYSDDGGDNWSEPVLLWRASEENEYPGEIDLESDDGGKWHVAWDNPGVPGDKSVIYYAQLDGAGGEWTKPEVLARTTEEKDEAAGIPSIVTHSDLLLLGFQQYDTGGTMRKWMRQSLDGGMTWSTATAPFSDPTLYGGNGAAVILFDSNENMHAILANRTGECCHGMWYSRWQDNHFGATQNIVMGPKTADFDPTIPTAAISQGNVILATWVNEAAPNVWYSFATLDAPALPRVPLTQPQITDNEVVAKATVAITATITAQPKVDPRLQSRDLDLQPLGPTLPDNFAPIAGAVAAMIVIAIVLIGSRTRRSRP
jgi:hypothetical protein